MYGCWNFIAHTHITPLAKFLQKTTAFKKATRIVEEEVDDPLATQ